MLDFCFTSEVRTATRYPPKRRHDFVIELFGRNAAQFDRDRADAGGNRELLFERRPVVGAGQLCGIHVQPRAGFRGEDVEAEALGRDQAGRQLSGVQADVHPRINGVEIVEHPHLQRVVAHGNEAVLGLNEIDADEAGLMRVHRCLDGFEAQQGLGENPLGSAAAQNLVDIANLDLAGGCGLWGCAVFYLAAQGFDVANLFPAGGDFIAQAAVEERFA